MLYLLRLIRKDLIRMNNVKKYFLYALGEIVLIVAGILIAVQIGNWNERRLQRVEERIMLERIQDEIEGGISLIPPRFETLERKNDALARVARVFEGQAIEDNLSFLEDVFQGRVWGWGMPLVNRITFDEYVSSGKLGLIRNVELRSQIMGFYDRAQSREMVAALRMGEYAQRVADLVPERGDGPILTGLSENEYAAIAASVLKSDLGSTIIREQSRTRTLGFIWNEIADRGAQLLAEIDAELEKR